MAKAKHKGKKRKGKLSDAMAIKARARLGDVRHANIPIHPDDLDGFDEIQDSFEYSLQRSTGWRCLECKYGFGGEYSLWRDRPGSQERCKRCGSSHIQQQDAKYRCMNCDHAFWDFPGKTLCPSSDCKAIHGKDHPGSFEERGRYVVWINYDEWISEDRTKWSER